MGSGRKGGRRGEDRCRHSLSLARTEREGKRALKSRRRRRRRHRRRGRRRRQWRRPWFFWGGAFLFCFAARKINFDKQGLPPRANTYLSV